MASEGKNVADSDQTLLSMLQRHRPLQLVGVYDALSARLAEQAGAAALWASGLCIATTLGMSDGELATYDVVVRQLWNIRNSVTLPVLADGNAGFGDADVVAHVVRQIEQIGIDGVCLEDKSYPRRNSFAEKPPEIAPIEEFGLKVDAAVMARRSKDFLVVARIEGLVAGQTIDEVLTRAEVYVSAGADAILIHSKSSSADEVIEFAGRWDGRAPLIVIPTTYPALSLQTAHDAGISAVIYANQLMRASMRAMRDLMNEFMAVDKLIECATDLATVAELLNVSDAGPSAATLARGDSLRSKLQAEAAKQAQGVGQDNGVAPRYTIGQR
jgi:phosphoenolpyruvate phosphomutase